MKDKDAMSLVFSGKRFAEHKIPLSMMSDLSYINKMVTDAASHIFLKKNPERQRIPKGFRDNVFLTMTEMSENDTDSRKRRKEIKNQPMTGMDKGSTIIGLEATHMRQQTLLTGTEEEECVREAFTAVIKFIEGTLPDPYKYLEEVITPYFNHIGQKLEPEESLSFEIGRKRSVLNLKTRRKLIEKGSEYAADMELYGAASVMGRQIKITFKDGVKGHIATFRDDTGKRELILDEDMFPGAKKALEKYGKEQKIYVRGIGAYKNKRLKRIERVEEYRLLDPQDIHHRLNELRFMEDGWMEGRGVAPNEEALLKLSGMFDEFYLSDEVLPYIFPTSSGNLEMEWRIGRRGITLEIDLSTFKSKITDSEKEDSRGLDLNTRTGWNTLNGILKA